MFGNLFTVVIEVSIASSFVIATLLLISPLIKKVYRAKWWYVIWLVLAVRLIIPFNITIPEPPVRLDAPTNVVSFGQTNIPISNLAQIAEHDSQMQIPTAAVQGHSYSVFEVLTLIWLLGVVVFALRLLAVYVSFNRKMKRQSRPVTNRNVISIFDQLCFELHIKKKPRISLCKNACSPMMYGFIKPVLFLPNGDFRNYDLEVILRHELVHYKRHDLWYKLLLLIANSIHWFNPLVYLMVKSAHEDIEFSCDDEVVRSADIIFRKRYSRAILNSMRKERFQSVVLSTQFKGGKSVMKKRFANILDIAKKRKGTVTLCASIILIFACGLFVACSQTVEKEMGKNIGLLKSGDIKSLVGFNIGDPINYDLVNVTDEYFGGGQISKSKSGEYSDIYLFFNEATTLFSGLAAENTGNFFGIELGKDEPQKIYDILGSPDKYEEESDMWNLPMAMYNFENSTLYIHMNNENQVIRILYKSNIDDKVTDDISNMEKSGTLYANDRLGFSVEFPSEWDGLFEIIENYVEYDERGGSGITVCQKASREIDSSIGAIFYIERWIGTWSEEEPPVYAGGSTVVLQSGKYTYILRTPSDVQYIENDEIVAAEYRKMYSQLDIIKANIKSVSNLYSGDAVEKEFLDSPEGKQLRTIAYRAAKAMLQADTEGLASCLITPDEASRRLRDITDVYGDLAILVFKYTDVKSDTEIWASYEYALTGEDSYTYVSMVLKKVNDEWKVSEIGLEK